MDIYSKADYPFNALSNFAAHEFTFDGVPCKSMEGFLQSLKFQDSSLQKKICLMPGREAKELGLTSDWRLKQTLYWQGKPFDRHGADYALLLARAYDALFYDSRAFKDALKAAGDVILQHSIGVADPHETVLTTDEFLSQLYRLRKKLLIV